MSSARPASQSRAERPAAADPEGPQSMAYGAHRLHGFTLMEMLLVVALAAATSAIGAGAARAVAGASALQAARVTLLLTLLEARRLAYASERTTEVVAAVGSDHFVVHGAPGEPVRRGLPHGVVVSKATRGGRVRFFPSGLAGNATVTLELSAAHAQTVVVVNQRGIIR